MTKRDIRSKSSNSEKKRRPAPNGGKNASARTGKPPRSSERIGTDTPAKGHPLKDHRGARSDSPSGQAHGTAGRRDAPQRIWLYGTHAVLAALKNPRRKIRKLLMSEETALALVETLDGIRAHRDLPVEEIIEKSDFERMLPLGAVHQGVTIQVDPLPAVAVEDIVEMVSGRDRAVVMVLDQVTDPHNVGAILRSAAAFGAAAVIVPDRHSPDETGTLAKAASGALERMPLARVTNVVRALDQLKEAGFWVAGLAGEAPRTLAEEKLSGRIALVMGAEGEGLRRLTRDHCDYLVKLPMTGAVESLNVSNAAAIALYELVRDSLPHP